MVFGYTMLGIGISAVIFWLIRLMARPAPSTMNKEYQEATNEYLRVRQSHRPFFAFSTYSANEPFSGVFPGLS